ncbi:MAG TPA: universal stress protein [Nitrososphaeraceae archaeon]|jgi:nucleotide-binding universal stress UspA family protein|nr:universal stress protein [Nitrososphaeraceae archaeon]
MISNRGIRNIRTILLSIDGSVTSMRAARFGISLAMRFKSDLIGLTVIDLMSLPYGYFVSETGTRSHEDDVLEEKRMEAKKSWRRSKDRC